jgi:hypothetical protein
MATDLKRGQVRLAAAAADGWAFVEDDRGLWLVRPPYRQLDRSRTSEAEMQRALFGEDFTVEPEPGLFDGWGAVCQSLQERIAKQATDAQKADASHAAEQLLSHATAAQVAKHLAVIEERIARRDLRGVEVALIALLAATSVSSSPELVGRVHSLLTAARRARPAARRPSAHSDWPVEDEAEVDRQSQAIKERGCLLGIAA